MSASTTRVFRGLRSASVLVASCLVASCLVAGLVMHAQVAAQDIDVQDIDVQDIDVQDIDVQEIDVREIQSALPDTTWYDSEEASIRPITVEEDLDDSLNRDSRWLPKPDRVKRTSSPTSNAQTTTNQTTNGFFGSGLTLTNLLGWLLLLVIIIAVAAAIAFALSRSEFDGGKSDKAKQDLLAHSPDEQMIERMKHLPAELRRTDVNLRSEAERLMRENEFDQAIILLFGHQLLLLDRVAMLRLNRGKTNRKYLREVRSVDPKTAKLLAATTAAFESSYFGDHRLDRPRFERLWQLNLELEQAVERRRGAAA